MPARSRILACTLLALAAAPTGRGWAISSFSRQYKTECTTCHTVYPRRNEFGEAFRLNGFVWPGRPAEAASGEQEAYWLSGILPQIPLAVSLFTSVSYDPDEEEDKLDPNTDLQLHLGGTIRDRIGYFAHDLLSDGAEAFGQFQRLPGVPVNLKLGKIVPKTTLWKPNQAATSAPFANLSVSVAGENNLGKPREAAELNAVLADRWFAAAGVADRDGQDRMEYYASIAWKRGGTDFAGREPEVDFEEESVWDFLAVTLNGYGYVGSTESVDDDYYRVGADAEILYKGFTLLVGGLFGRDEDADGEGLEVDTAVYLGEVDWMASTRWLLALRYEYVDVGNSSSGVQNRVVGAVNFAPIQNVLLRLEGLWDHAEDRDDQDSLTASILATYHL